MYLEWRKSAGLRERARAGGEAAGLKGFPATVKQARRGPAIESGGAVAPPQRAIWGGGAEPLLAALPSRLDCARGFGGGLGGLTHPRALLGGDIEFSLLLSGLHEGSFPRETWHPF